MRPLVDQLTTLGLSTWLDESEVKIGDSLRGMIDIGLMQSRFGLVVLSPSFFAKRWTRTELDGLVAREAEHEKVILPVWHDVALEDVRKYSPILAGRLAVSTSEGLAAVAKAVHRAVEVAGGRTRFGAPIYAGRLTKTALLSLPSGAFLLSNSLNPDLSPTLAEVIPGLPLREQYWDRLRSTGMTGFKFYVFATAEEYRAHMNARDVYEPLDSLRGKHV